MNKIRLRNNRPKALFGTEEAAILGAAAIGAAATGAAATLGSVTATKAAKQQADATISSAKTQAESAVKLNDNNNQLQKDSIAFTKEQNQQTNDIQKNIQMSLQLMSGQQSIKDANEASKIQLKNGGKVKPNNKGGHLLQGVSPSNMSLAIKDGGTAVNLGETKEGFNLIELKGDSHNERHIAPDGKTKTGVGVKIGNKTVEGEGDEKVLLTPNNGIFLSKHNIKGFNPSEEVDKGMDPLKAAQIQESIKDKYNIPDDGKGTSNKAKNGKSMRSKCKLGSTAQVYGAGINALGNMGGALITTLGNNKVSGIVTKANAEASKILADAYGNMTGIDPNIVSKSDYEAPHVLANIRSAKVNVNPQVEAVNRSARNQQVSINNNTLSSAARLSRTARLQDDTTQKLDELYGEQGNKEEAINQDNMKQLNTIASENANRDAQSNKDYTSTKLAIAQYNNDINNSKISGQATAESDNMTQTAGLIGQLQQSTSNAWGSATTASLSSVGNTLASISKQKSDEDTLKLAMGFTNPNGTPREGNITDILSNNAYLKYLNNKLNKKYGLGSNLSPADLTVQ